MNSTLDADALIAEEGLNDANPAFDTEQPPVEAPKEDTPAEQPKDGTEPEVPAEQPPTAQEPEAPKAPEAEQPKEDVQPEAPATDAVKTIEEARSFMQSLNLTPDRVFNEDGSAKAWNEVVPAGKYLASQLEPVIVTDKDGKTHEFMLLSDVEKAFPDGFEAKNNIEQMKFERAIIDNESKFKEAVHTYNDAERRYNEEVNQVVEERTSNARLASEYRAMADQGLVPKVGDANDPKFSESEAVKEMNRIMDWMDKKNAENEKNGLGKINSLYVAKQLMDVEAGKQEKQEKKQSIISERNQVASLSSSPTPVEDKKVQTQAPTPLSRLADVIIEEEGLR